MRNTRNTLLFLLFFQLISAQEVIPIEIPIQEIKVFDKSAQINRSGNIEIKKGTHFYDLDRISKHINKSSLKISSDQEISIYSIQTSLEFKDKPDSLAISDAEDDRLLHMYTIQDIDAKLAGKEAQLELLASNKKLGTASEVASLDNIMEISEYYLQRDLELRNQMLELQLDKDSLLRELQKITLQFRGDNKTKKRDRYSKIFVEINSKNSQTIKLDVNYQVEKAGWYSSYEVRANKLNDKLELVHKAKVVQNTGVDWEDVKITLSTAEPNTNTHVPNLKTWGIDAGARHKAPKKAKTKHGYYSIQERYIRGRITDAQGNSIEYAEIMITNSAHYALSDKNGNYILFVPPGQHRVKFNHEQYGSQIISANASNILNHQFKTRNTPTRNVNTLSAVAGGVKAINIRGSRKNVTNYYVDGVRVSANLKDNRVPHSAIKRSLFKDYELDLGFTMKTYQKTQTLELETHLLDAEYEHHCVPKLDLNAYLIAKFSNWQELELPSGVSSIFFENTFVGNSKLDFENLTTDTMIISLGADQSINLQREVKPVKRKKNLVGNKRIKEIEVLIQVKNVRDRAIKLVIKDQVPISSERYVKVEFESEDFVKKELSGELIWTGNIPERAETKKKFKYKVISPKEMNVPTE